MKETMNFTPYGDYLLLRERERVERSKSGIIMLEGAEGDYIYADVDAAGSGLYTHNGVQIPMSVKPGDVVMLHKSMAGDQKRVKMNDTEYLLVRESEIVMFSRA
jgi:chaperonin GroES